jgi:hypothetical protein
VSDADKIAELERERDAARAELESRLRDALAALDTPEPTK